MKRLCFAAIPALLLVLLLTACVPKDPGVAPPADSGSSAASQSASVEEPFVFTRDNLPRLDGSTSTVPLARSMCAVLLGEDQDQVADLIQFSRTTQSYRNLMWGEADLLLAAEPAPEVLSELEEGDRWLLTPFATDALVFVVNQNNPVDNLTTEQVQKIYTGEITNWKEVGGEDLDIVPFQRNQEAGSQTMFEKLSDLFQTAIRDVSDLMLHFQNTIRRCMNSIAILILTNCLMPLLTFFILKWILKETFQIVIPMMPVRRHRDAGPAADFEPVVAGE